MVWVIVVLVVFAVAALGVVVLSRRNGAGAAAAPTPDEPSAPRERPAEPPMSGLESALSQVTDRDGRPIGERIDAGAEHVDELRVPDDTGPILRRALDHAERRPEPVQPPSADRDTAAAPDNGDNGDLDDDGHLDDRE